MRYSRRQFTRNTLIASLTYPSLAMPLLAQSSGRSYTVRKGDTLSHIARRHQTTVTAIPTTCSSSDRNMCAIMTR